MRYKPISKKLRRQVQTSFVVLHLGKTKNAGHGKRDRHFFLLFVFSCLLDVFGWRDRWCAVYGLLDRLPVVLAVLPCSELTVGVLLNAFRDDAVVCLVAKKC